MFSSGHCVTIIIFNGAVFFLKTLYKPGLDLPSSPSCSSIFLHYKAETIIHNIVSYWLDKYETRDSWLAIWRAMPAETFIGQRRSVAQLLILPAVAQRVWKWLPATDQKNRS